MKIVLLVDNKNWCWTTQMKSLAQHLPEHSYKMATADGWKNHYRELIEWADLIYMRGYPYIYMSGITIYTKPYIWTLSTGGENLKMRYIQSQNWIQPASAIIVQNNTALDVFPGDSRSKVHVIPSHVDTRLFAPSGKKPDAYRVGLAGNTTGLRKGLKGIDFVTEACNAIGVECRHATLENPIEHKDMPAYYNSLSIYAQPSDSEGCSNSVMEAMSSGLPCLICRGVGYHGEVCDGDPKSPDCNVLFVERNAESIAANVSLLMKSKSLYGKISINARKFAERHSWVSGASKYNAIFRDVVRNFVFDTNCFNCLYWIGRNAERNACTRFPPAVSRAVGECGIFPMTDKSCKCGEWRLK